MGLTDTVCDPSHCFGGLLFIRITVAVSVCCCSAALPCTTLALAAAPQAHTDTANCVALPVRCAAILVFWYFYLDPLSACDGVRASVSACVPIYSVTFVRFVLGQSVERFPCFVALFRSSEPYYTLSHRDKLCGYPLLHTLGTRTMCAVTLTSRAAIFAIFPP